FHDERIAERRERPSIERLRALVIGNGKADVVDHAGLLFRLNQSQDNALIVRMSVMAGLVPAISLLGARPCASIGITGSRRANGSLSARRAQRPGDDGKPTLRIPASLRRPGSPVRFSFPLERGMERREAPGCLRGTLGG